MRSGSIAISSMRNTAVGDAGDASGRPCTSLAETVTRARAGKVLFSHDRRAGGALGPG